MAKTIKTKATEFKKRVKLSGVIWNDDTPNLKKMADEADIPLAHAVSIPAYALEKIAEDDYSSASAVFQKWLSANKHQLPQPKGVKADAEFTAEVSDDKSKVLNDSLKALENMSEYNLRVYVAKLKATKMFKLTSSLSPETQQAA